MGEGTGNGEQGTVKDYMHFLPTPYFLPSTYHNAARFFSTVPCSLTPDPCSLFRGANP